MSKYVKELMMDQFREGSEIVAASPVPDFVTGGTVAFPGKDATGTGRRGVRWYVLP